MNIEELQLITRTETANLVLKFFTNVETHVGPITDEMIDLESFWSFLITKGFNPVKEDYNKFFNELSIYGVGWFNEHVGRNPSIFNWKYRPGIICDQILNPNKMVNIEEGTMRKNVEAMVVIKKRPGRPKGSSNKQTELDLGTTDETIVKTTRGKKPVSKEIILMFETTKGELFPLSMTDADRFINHIKKVQAQLSA